MRAILRFTLAESCPDPAEVLRSRDLPDAPDPRTVFLKLRELRNDW